MTKKILNLLLIILVVLCAVVMSIVALTFPNKSVTPTQPLPPTLPSPSPTPVPPKKSFIDPDNPLQRTIVGLTRQQEVEANHEIISVTTQSDGSQVYQLHSAIEAVPDTIKTKNSQVVYEQVHLPFTSSQPGAMSLVELKQKYVEPEEIITTGSHFYGQFAHTYLYVSRGVTAVVDSINEVVRELQFFEPMSKETYLQQYGADIAPPDSFGERFFE